MHSRGRAAGHPACLLQIHLVQGGDLQLAASAGLDLLGHLHDLVIIEVKAGDSVVALGVGGLFLNVGGVAVLVKGHNAEALGVVDIVAENGAAPCCGVGSSGLQPLGETGAVEDVVAQNHRTAVIADELLAQNKGLCQTVRTGLDLVLQVQAVLAAVTQQRLKARGVRGGGNDQNVLDAASISVDSG